MSSLKIQRLGISEKKKAELDALATRVQDAQDQVDQYQATVTSLTEKSNKFRDLLAQVESNRSSALNNKNLADQPVQSAIDLQNDSDSSSAEITGAGEKTGAMAAQVKMVTDKLIYTAEVLSRLANMVIREKAINPLISDELVSLLSTAGTDANNAVSLTLIALQSSFAAQTSAIESVAVIDFEYEQAKALYSLLTGASGVAGKTSLQALIDLAYQDANGTYEETNKACAAIAAQLNDATLKLGDAQVNLKSLQAGFAAGNAATLAG